MRDGVMGELLELFHHTWCANDRTLERGGRPCSRPPTRCGT